MRCFKVPFLFHPQGSVYFQAKKIWSSRREEDIEVEFDIEREQQKKKTLDKAEEQLKNFKYVEAALEAFPQALLQAFVVFHTNAFSAENFPIFLSFMTLSLVHITGNRAEFKSDYRNLLYKGLLAVHIFLDMMLRILTFVWSLTGVLNPTLYCSYQPSIIIENPTEANLCLLGEYTSASGMDGGMWIFLLVVIWLGFATCRCCVDMVIEGSCDIFCSRPKKFPAYFIRPFFESPTLLFCLDYLKEHICGFLLSCILAFLYAMFYNVGAEARMHYNEYLLFWVYGGEWISGSWTWGWSDIQIRIGPPGAPTTTASAFGTTAPPTTVPAALAASQDVVAFLRVAWFLHVVVLVFLFLIDVFISRVPLLKRIFAQEESNIDKKLEQDNQEFMEWRERHNRLHQEDMETKRRKAEKKRLKQEAKLRRKLAKQKKKEGETSAVELEIRN